MPYAHTHKVSVEFQVQCSIQSRNSEVGCEADWLHRDHRELACCAEPLGLPGGCVRRWRHR